MMFDGMKAVGMCILFFVSNLGYWEYFRRKTKINIFFVPAFVVSAQTTLLFCSGILNCLGTVSTLLFASGIVLALYYMAKDSKSVFRTYLNAGYIFFAIAVFLIIIAVHGHVLTHTDNFSHWAFVARNMLETDRYPCYKDTMIWFKTYPLGSATYIYYAARIISASEQTFMFAQAYFMISFILPVFKYVRYKTKYNS